MSSLKVEIVLIDAIEKHPNADRLDIATIKGWQCVVGRNAFQAGDKAIYFPIDSILPPELEAKIFGPESKVKLTKSRVRTIKLRGAISQGLLVSLEDLGVEFTGTYFRAGDDLTERLGVTKYEPPVSIGPRSGVQATTRKRTNPFFRKYTDIENYKNYPKLFDDELEIVAHEKIHGTNFRAGWVPFHPYTIWEKIIAFFRLAPKWKFVYGSHNVQLQDKFLYHGFYDKNVYSEAVGKYNLQTLLLPGYVVYGEIYGSGIQKGYDYGLKEGERKLAVFDIKVNDQYLGFDDLKTLCKVLGLEMAPIVYSGTHPGNADLKMLTEGDSLIGPTAFGREGLVIRPREEQMTFMGRKILKFKSDTFLLKAEDDTH